MNIELKTNRRPLPIAPYVWQAGELNQITQEIQHVIKEAGIIPDADVVIQLKQALDSLYASTSTFPAGVTVEYRAPSGNPYGRWLPCEGAAVSRETYAELFSAIGVTYGTGDGVSTFNLPDDRALFKRGAGSRSITTTPGGTTTISTGDAGTIQTDAIRNITGDFKASKNELTNGGVSGAIYRAGQGTNSRYSADGAGNSGNYGQVGFDASRVAPTANENRPANISTRYFISY